MKGMTAKKLVFTIVLVALFPVYSINAAEVKLLYFYIDGCSWCEKMDKILEDSSIKRILSNTTLVKIKVNGKKRIDGDKTEEQLAKQYNIKGVPTIVFLDSSGEELLRVPGLLSKEDFKDVLCNYVSGIKKGC
ncbi:MAG: thioredoxin fold domain-containing protein [Nitrospirae bacterium]|nr:thioredoxin fold domain-containing protein [Nitrospirota bacterium]